MMVPTDATSIAIWIPAQLRKLSSFPVPNCSNRATGHLPLLPLHPRNSERVLLVLLVLGERSRYQCWCSPVPPQLDDGFDQMLHCW